MALDTKQTPPSGTQPPDLRQRIARKWAALCVWWQIRLAHGDILMHRWHKAFAGTRYAWLLGQWFYQVGFGAEYMVVQAGRLFASACGMVWRGLRWAAVRLSKILLQWLRDIWQDLTGPITGMFRGLRGLRHTAKASYAGDGAPAAAKNSADNDNGSGIPEMSDPVVIAGLAADGTTSLREIHHLDRGYEGLDSALQGLGAHIQRIEE